MEHDAATEATGTHNQNNNLHKGLEQELQSITVSALTQLYSQNFSDADFQVNITKPEFEGDYSIVTFALSKKIGKAPTQIAAELGDYLLQNNSQLIAAYNVVKGFLNVTITNQFWNQFLQTNYQNNSFGTFAQTGKRVMVEYSSPNTNKPLHLGHLRNNFLGWSVAQILKQTGNTNYKSEIINDRGIHICKSMVSWLRFANGATPESTGIKGDHFVGMYYVKYNDVYKLEVNELVTKGVSKDDAEKQAPIYKEAQQMLVQWEAGDPAVRALWNTMNGWVYKGFEQTYDVIGSDFDKNYYESDTYLLGKHIVAEGLSKGVFYKKKDGSVWVDLTDEGLDEKVLLRSDGTSVYITQDLGLAELRQKEFDLDEAIYVIADEQNYHMQVLQAIAKKLQMPNASGIKHLSYGMVELPTGRMKSREGTVVDADDIVAEMIAKAAEKTAAYGKTEGFTKQELMHLHTIVGLAALKFYLLKVDPKKKMIFNPDESIDFHGFTGPFIQYTYARIKSILRKNLDFIQQHQNQAYNVETTLEKKEIDLLILLEQYKNVLEEAVDLLDPSKVANYVYHLAKTYSSFYAEYDITTLRDAAKKLQRIQLSSLVAETIKKCMFMLGMEVPERM